MSRHTRSLTTLLPLLAATLTLAACGPEEDDAHPLGEAVATPFYSLLEGTEQGPGTVAVTDVRVGEPGDLEAAGFELDPDQAAATPHYVDITFTSAADVPLDLRDPSGVDQHDTLVPSLTVLELGEGAAFAPCPLLPDTVAPGATVEGCAIVLVPDGVELEQVSWLPDTSEEFIYWESGH